MFEGAEIMESIREACGYGEDYKSARLWETGMDELQQEDWENYMGGPDDCEFEAQRDIHENPWEKMETGMEQCEFGESSQDDAEISMITADKRQTEIFQWLRLSPMATPVNRGGEGDFFLTRGWPVRLKSGPVLELLSWLETEGFHARLLLAGYTISKGLLEESGAETMIFQQRPPVEVPFERKTTHYDASHCDTSGPLNQIGPIDFAADCPF